MRYLNTDIIGMGYELAPNVVTSEDLEQRLLPVYETLHLQPGQLEALTGIVERRFWDFDVSLSQTAIRAAQKAMVAADVAPEEIGMLIYGGVCRENLEPATACAVADGIGVGPECHIYDLSNACLGVLNGMLNIANAIELGQIDTGMVVSSESCRQIIDMTIDRLLAAPNMALFKDTIATLTGGSGAVAVILRRHDSDRPNGHRLLGGAVRNAARYHGLCIWGPDTGIPASMPLVMKTDSVGVLNHGVALGIETFKDLKHNLDWSANRPDKIICHQVGSTHQRTILKSLGIAMEKDFTTYQYLGNMGTVSLPLTAAIADERGFLKPGDIVGFLGIGSGLNCIMFGIKW